VNPADLRRAQEWIAASNNIVGFTGAGISTESGIPDFRSPNGVWARNRIIEFGEFVASPGARAEAWRQRAEMWPAMRDAPPNPGHLAFVDLERRGKLRALITQNIDRLHQRAGQSAEVMIELHGTTTEAACLSCGDRIPMDEAIRRVRHGEAAPECKKCGGLLKAATVSFGQQMPEHEMARAAAASQSCEVFLAVGSSLVVQPAAMFPAVAKRSGARLIIINRTPTPLDDVADLVVREEIGQTLPALVGPDSAFVGR
jgi:NAD-dependent deacetylase